MIPTIDTARWGLRRGTPALRTAGPLAAGPDGLLFIADNVAASIFAIAPRYNGSDIEGPVEVADLDSALAELLGTSADDVEIVDLVTLDEPSAVIVSARRRSVNDVFVIGQIQQDGSVTRLELDGVPFAEYALDDAPAETDERTSARVLQAGTGDVSYTFPDGRVIEVVNDPYRTTTVTDMHYVDSGYLFVAGSSNEEFAATLRQIPLPFGGTRRSNTLEIFHVSHGRFETASPIQSFVPFSSTPGDILAVYTCTPVVRFSLQDAEPGAHVVGTSVADLGPGSSPLDIISLGKDEDEYFLVSNTTHPLMKVGRKGIESQAPLTEKADHVGAARFNLPHENVSLMGSLRGGYVAMLQRGEDGRHALRSYPADSL